MENQTPLLKSPKTNKKYIWIVVIFALIFGTGFFVWQYGWLVEDVPILQLFTSRWKTYKDTDSGFEIKYPQNWESSKGQVPMNNQISFSPKENRIPEQVLVYAEIEKKENLPAQPYYSPINFFGTPSPNPTEVQIGGKKFYKSENKFEAVRTIIYAFANKDGSKIAWITLAIRYGRQRMDYYLPDSEIEPELKIFNRMLSSFKFLE
jgi:hypothetical protein